MSNIADIIFNVGAHLWSNNEVAAVHDSHVASAVTSTSLATSSSAVTLTSLVTSSTAVTSKCIAALIYNTSTYLVYSNINFIVTSTSAVTSTPTVASTSTVTSKSTVILRSTSTSTWAS